jgi:hypothetical protein
MMEKLLCLVKVNDILLVQWAMEKVLKSPSEDPEPPGLLKTINTKNRRFNVNVKFILFLNRKPHK